MPMREGFHSPIRSHQPLIDKTGGILDRELGVICEETMNETDVFLGLRCARAIDENSSCLDVLCRIFENGSLRLNESYEIFRLALPFGVRLLRENTET